MIGQRGRRSIQGQATVEMVFIIPLLLFMAAGCAAVVYMCWQGIKVQEAANVAARIHGQERVAGGPSASAITQDNGLSGLGSGDVDPTETWDREKSVDELRAATFAKREPAIATSVYGRVKKNVREFFTSEEQKDLYIPAPKTGAVGYSDSVKVVRIVKFPKIFGFEIKPIVLSAESYGGEDSRMYGLPRWGRRTQSDSPSNAFWKSTIQATND